MFDGGGSSPSSSPSTRKSIHQEAADLRDTVATLTSRVSELEGENADLTSQVAALNASLEASRGAQEELDVAKRSIAALENAVVAGDAAAAEAAAFREAAGEKIAGYEAALRKGEEEVDKLRMALALAENEVEREKNVILSLRATVERVSAANDDDALVKAGRGALVITEEGGYDDDDEGDEGGGIAARVREEEGLMEELEREKREREGVESKVSMLQAELALAYADLEAEKSAHLVTRRKLQLQQQQQQQPPTPTPPSPHPTPPPTPPTPPTPAPHLPTLQVPSPLLAAATVGTPNSPNLVLDALIGVTSDALQDEMKSKPWEKEVQDLKRVSKQQEDYIQRLHNSLKKATLEADGARSEADGYRREIAALEAQVRMLEAQVEDARTAAEALASTALSVREAAVEAIDARMESASSARMLDLETQVLALRNELDAKEEERQRLGAAVTESHASLQRMSGLQAELHDLKGRHLRLQLESEAVAASGPPKGWETQVMEYKVAAKEAQLELGYVKDELERVVRERDEAQGRIQRAEDRVAAATEKYELVLSMGPSRETVEALRYELRQALEERDEARREAEHAASSLATQKEASDHATRRTLEALEGELARLRSAYAKDANQLQLQVAMESAASKAHLARISALESQVGELEHSNGLLVQRTKGMSSLRAELDSVNRQLSARDAAIDRLRIEKSAIESLVGTSGRTSGRTTTETAFASSYDLDQGLWDRTPRPSSRFSYSSHHPSTHRASTHRSSAYRRRRGNDADDDDILHLL